MKEKICKMLKNMPNIIDYFTKNSGFICKIWILDPRVKYETLMKEYSEFKNQKTEKKFRANLKRLEDSTTLEEAEIGDTDILIIEFKD